MKSGIHLQKKLRQVVTKDGAIVTYRLVHFPKQGALGNDKSKATNLVNATTGQKAVSSK